MIYKELGKTGQKISALGFGGGIGGVKSNTSNYSGMESALFQSLDLGVNFIDTSPVYGNGDSERIIGKAIKDIRANIILATKVLPGRTDYKGVVESVEESRTSMSQARCFLLEFLRINSPSIDCL